MGGPGGGGCWCLMVTELLSWVLGTVPRCCEFASGPRIELDDGYNGQNGILRTCSRSKEKREAEGRHEPVCELPQPGGSLGPGAGRGWLTRGAGVRLPRGPSPEADLAPSPERTGKQGCAVYALPRPPSQGLSRAGFMAARSSEKRREVLCDLGDVA